MDTGLLLGLASMLCQELLRRPMYDLFGNEDCGGTPRWRAGLVLFPQLVVMFGSCIAAAAAHGFSMERWCADCGKRGLGPASGCAVHSFLAYLLSDLLYWYSFPPPPVVMRPLMVFHHVLCMGGTLYAMRACPRATLPCFTAAIVALEFGSGFSNLFHLFRDSPGVVPVVKPLYFLGMTISNSGGTYFLLAWGRSMRDSNRKTHPLARWVPILISLILIVMRQETVHRLAGPTGWSW